MCGGILLNYYIDKQWSYTYLLLQIIQTVTPKAAKIAEVNLKEAVQKRSYSLL